MEVMPKWSLYGQAINQNEEDASFMNQVWDANLKIYTSVKDLQKNLQAREWARLMKLDERMRTIEDTITHFEDSTAQAP
ncbi:hypothetical protein D8674_031073 [Pyrus ussuriensis x Pyrus communis]|uniref:Uncharacterized protein n=1 Tax=Pyrus ussuriensis x Pyrus communis TaxID=2448454 RepID=A0A5N5EYP9_9ROSA|nr:hypothetical protein D8674_031073 [Pyrus ussuriensis x Pyrus communis]